MRPEQWDTFEHFKPEEFDSPDEPGSGIKMDFDFMRKLEAMRDRAGFPFRIRSGFRTKAHNKAVGGKPNSAHTKGLAADIAYATSQEAWKIMDAAWYEGITRVEVCDKHVHVDGDRSLPQNVLVWGKSR